MSSQSFVLMASMQVKPLHIICQIVVQVTCKRPEIIHYHFFAPNCQRQYKSSHYETCEHQGKNCLTTAALGLAARRNSWDCVSLRGWAAGAENVTPSRRETRFPTLQLLRHHANNDSSGALTVPRRPPGCPEINFQNIRTTVVVGSTIIAKLLESRRLARARKDLRLQTLTFYTS